MKIKFANTYEAKLYIGSKEGYHGKEFTEEELTEVIGKYQKKAKRENMICVRITPTRFLVADYNERGHEVAVINYPRYPKTAEEYKEFMINLAKHLLVTFKQNRVSVVFPNRTMMFESDDAEEAH